MDQHTRRNTKGRALSHYEPPENDVVTAAGSATRVSSMSIGAKRVSIMATGASPKADGGEYVLKELTYVEQKKRRNKEG